MGFYLKDRIHFKLCVRSAFGGPFTQYSSIPAFPPGRMPDGQEANGGQAPNLYKIDTSINGIPDAVLHVIRDRLGFKAIFLEAVSRHLTC